MYIHIYGELNVQNVYIFVYNVCECVYSEFNYRISYLQNKISDHDEATILILNHSKGVLKFT